MVCINETQLNDTIVDLEILHDAILCLGTIEHTIALVGCLLQSRLLVLSLREIP